MKDPAPLIDGDSKKTVPLSDRAFKRLTGRAAKI